MTVFLEVVVIGTLPCAILLFKAKGWMALWSLLIPYAGLGLALVGSFRMAKPHSWWARRFYATTKLRAARERYPDVGEEPDEDLWRLGVAVLVVFCFVAVLRVVGAIEA